MDSNMFEEASEDSDPGFSSLSSENEEETEGKWWGHHLYGEYVKFPPDLILAMRSNLPPSRPLLQSTLASKKEPEAHVNRFDARIAELDLHIELLKKEKELLWSESLVSRTKVAGYNLVLSPIRRVPLDIIREIALHTLPEHPSLSYHQSPVNISQVSFIWRAAALSLPQLWTTLHIDVDLSVAPETQHADRGLLGFFEHARTHPLSLFLHFDFEYGDKRSAERKNLQFFLRRISSCMPRVRRLGLGAREIGLIWGNFELDGTPWRLDLLEYLHVFDSDSDGEVDLPPTRIFQGAPLLKTLSVRGDYSVVPSALKQGPPIFDWSFLTNVRIAEELEFREWTKLMDMCPRLQLAQFRVYFSGPAGQAGSRPKQSHLDLHELCLHLIEDEDGITALLSRFHLPALRNLRLSYEYSDYEEDRVCPSASKFSSFQHIRHLSLWFEGRSKAPPDLANVLRETTNLVDLNIVACTWTICPVFTSMTLMAPSTVTSSNAAQGNPMLPQLTTLRVPMSYLRRSQKVVDETLTDADVCFKMLASRRASQVPLGVQPLKRVTFCHSTKPESGSEARGIPAEFQARLAECVAEGMEVTCGISEPELDRGILMPTHPFDTRDRLQA